MRKFECKKQDCPYKRCYVELDHNRIVLCLNGWTDYPQWNELLEKSESKLPKLTVEALKERGIEWPKWAKYAAVNHSQVACFYENEPERDYMRRMWVNYSGGVAKDIPGKWDASNWTDSQIMRPAVEWPKWCKVGAWVYHIALNKYAKVRELTSDGFIAEDGTAFRLCDPDYFKPARVREWDKVEMRQQVGKTFILDDGCVHALCMAATDRELFFLDTYAFDNECDTMRGISYSSDTIRYYNTLADGKPCGVLEVVK